MAAWQHPGLHTLNPRNLVRALLSTSSVSGRCHGPVRTIAKKAESPPGGNPGSNLSYQHSARSVGWKEFWLLSFQIKCLRPCIRIFGDQILLATEELVLERLSQRSLAPMGSRHPSERILHTGLAEKATQALTSLGSNSYRKESRIDPASLPV